MVIKYAVTTLSYTIFCNVDYVMGETSTEPISANIKYMIFRCEKDTGNIKDIKIRKLDQ